MSSLEMIHLDLECGGHRGSAGFSQVEGSTYPQFYPNADGVNDGSYDFDHKIEQVLNSVRISSMVGSQSWVESKNEAQELKVHSEKVERDCRICQMSLDFDDGDQDSGVPIELGCSCKDDLAAAHKHCAEAWFKIKGNKTCEICNSIAHNVVGPNDVESSEHANETTAAASAPSSSTRETRTCLNGHRFLNFLLACMVFAFVISWLFHFNIPS